MSEYTYEQVWLGSKELDRLSHFTYLSERYTSWLLSLQEFVNEKAIKAEDLPKVCKDIVLLKRQHKEGLHILNAMIARLKKQKKFTQDADDLDHKPLFLI